MSEFLRDAFPWIPAEWIDWVGWALIALGLLVLIVLLWRVAGGARSLARRTSEARLAVVEAAEVDQRRRLVLVRRDGVEHLIMIGGPSDIVVERGIGLATAQSPRAAPVDVAALRRSTPSTRSAPGPLEARAEPLAPAPAREARSAPKPPPKTAEPVVPPRVDVPDAEPAAQDGAAPAIRREPAFTRTAGSGVSQRQPSVVIGNEPAKDVERPGDPPEGPRASRDVRDTNDLVAEIDDILSRTPRDRN